MKKPAPVALRYHPKGAIKVADKQSDAVAYIYTSSNPAYVRLGKAVPCAMMFFGKRAKPVWQFRFGDEGRRAAKIEESFKDRREAMARKAEAAASRKATGNPYKVGDLFRRVWGYDQTNVDYYEVIESKGKYVTVQRGAQKAIENGSSMTGICTPQPGQLDQREKPKRCLVQGERIKINHYAHAYFHKPQIVAGVPVYPVDRFSTYA